MGVLGQGTGPGLSFLTSALGLFHRDAVKSKRNDAIESAFRAPCQRGTADGHELRAYYTSGHFISRALMAQERFIDEVSDPQNAKSTIQDPTVSK